MAYNEKIFNFIVLMLKKLPKYPWYYYLGGAIAIIILICIIYSYFNERFIAKYGYSIFEWDMIKLASTNGVLLFIGTFWKEYAVKNAKNVLYPELLMGFSILSFAFFTLGMITKFYQEKRKLGWLNILLTILIFGILYVFTGMLIFLVIIYIIGRSSANRRPRKRKLDPNREGNPYWVALEQERINKKIPSINLKNDEYN